MVLSLSGNIFLVVARMYYTGNLYYGFLLWNLFLAAIPLLISRKLYTIQNSNRFVLYSGLCLWLLFLPNAPYILTDLVHLYARPPVPYWYDMLLVILSASNGLALGFISINYIEIILYRRNAELYLVLFRILIILSMSYGVYLGRFLRYNSWDVIFKPFEVIRGAIDSLKISTISFVFVFSFVTFILYSFFRLILQHRSQEVS
jgi:uncharacterized membrane protein